MDASDAPAFTATAERTAVELTIDGETVEIDHGAVVIAAITSLHEHLQPGRDDRRRAAREEGGRARARRASRG